MSILLFLLPTALRRLRMIGMEVRSRVQDGDPTKPATRRGKLIIPRDLLDRLHTQPRVVESEEADYLGDDNQVCTSGRASGVLKPKV